MSIHIPRIVKRLGDVFDKAGFSCFLVGGAVRNMLCGKKPTDYDIATDALPEQVKHLFSRVIPTGIKHGTVSVIFQNQTFEVTTFRIEGKYSDARRPDSIDFAVNIDEDLSRRDFTINSIAVNTKNGEVIDPNNGSADLKSGIIRAIGDPNKRFHEDALRMIRACRFAAQLNFAIDPDTLRGINRNHDRITAVSVERIKEELEKTLRSEHPSIAFLRMDETHLLEMILPELSRCRGIPQKGIPELDLFIHSIRSCDAASSDNLVVRLAALLHDIGKPDAMVVADEGGTSFHQHEKISAASSRAVLRRLRFPNIVQRRVCHLIANHMIQYDENWTDAAVRRFIKRVGKENINDFFALKQADALGIDTISIDYRRKNTFQERIQKMLDGENALSLKDLAVNGNELASNAGIPRGPEMRTVLNYLLEAVIDDPAMNKKEPLLEIARNFYNKYVVREK